MITRLCPGCKNKGYDDKGTLILREFVSGKFIWECDFCGYNNDKDLNPGTKAIY